MSAPKWAPSTTYVPGAIVRPTGSTDTVIDDSQPLNNGFESGSTDWTLGTQYSIDSSVAYAGTKSLKFAGVGVYETHSTDTRIVVPGQSITAQCMSRADGNLHADGSGARVHLIWRDSGGSQILLSADPAPHPITAYGWIVSSVTGYAPAGAATVAVGVSSTIINADQGPIWADQFTWNYQTPLGASGLLYKAVQADPAKSAGTEPVWPKTLGVTVIDGGVTWEAIQGTLIEWTAAPLDISGGTEPTWPTVPGGVVNDNGVTWVTSSPVITDPNCPSSPIARIGASKIFIGDNDIVRFCATNNADDWTTQYDAGYLATGLQSDTETECTALGLYRGNLAVFMSSNLQLWQIDPDPAAMSFLDQVPGIGTDFARGVASVTNDLYFLSTLGVRSASISAGTANLEAGDVGTPIDSLIQEDLTAYRAAVALGERPEWDPLGIYVPAAGQYVLFMGNHAWVFSYSPSAQLAAWSQYTLPWYVTDACTLDGDLYVRSNQNNVYRLNKEAELNGEAMNDDRAPYTVVARWPYESFGATDQALQAYGVDVLFNEKVIGTAGVTNVQLGYDENNLASLTTAVPVSSVAARGEDGFVPIEIMAPSVSAQVTYLGDGGWELTQLNLYTDTAPRAP